MSILCSHHHSHWFVPCCNLCFLIASLARRQFAPHPDLVDLRRAQDARAVNIPSWGPAPVSQTGSRRSGAGKYNNTSRLRRRGQQRGRDGGRDGPGGSESDEEGGPARNGPADDTDIHTSEDDEAQHAEHVRMQQVYIASLWKKYGLRRKPQAPDGNCLFRSISDQVYGDPKYHTIVRGYTVDYMQIQRNSFQPFVAPSMRDFEVYLKFMRCNGTNYKAVWGGEPELQAMSELYQRPIVVFSAREGTGEA